MNAEPATTHRALCSCALRCSSALRSAAAPPHPTPPSFALSSSSPLLPPPLQVLSSQGLCIALHGLDSVGPPIIYGLDGAAHIRVQFRLILFRPFASEVVMGKIKACDATGILVSVDFFDHIFVPASELQYPSHFDRAEGLWVWRYQGHDLFMDLEEDIRVRITGVKFEQQKGGPSLTEEELAVMAPGSAAGTLAPAVVEAAAAKKLVKKPTIANFEPPMKVMASIKDDGLGLLSWWD